MEANLILSIAFSVIGVLFTTIGYFLKIQHNDIRRAIEEQGKLKGKIELVHQENNLRYEKMEAVTQQKLDRLTDEVTRLAKIFEYGFKHGKLGD